MQKGHISIKKVLAGLKIEALNEMQTASLEAAKKGKDFILLADTGSGKTLGFLLPVLQRLDTTNPKTQALVIVPSRELALQIEQVFKSMSTGFKVTCCYGGHKREIEENNLVEAPALIIGTPGRLADHIRRGNIQLDSIEVLVLDEFDKSLELGFQEEVSFIVGSLKHLKKRILTSATEAVDIPDFIELDHPERLNFLSGTKSEALAIQYVQSEEPDKIETLFRLICRIDNRSAIVFCNHRDAVERTSSILKEKGIVNVFYHGALEQPERDAALCKFRNGTSNVLVTTDLASRGLDIANIRYIIHYHLPSTEEVFIHRNGRTARMEASGTAILILGPQEDLPPYVDAEIENITLPKTFILPEKPKWTTLFIAAGKKDKVNKVDIVGFLSNKGQMKKEDIGLIEVKDFFSFVAVRKSKASHTLQLIKDEKIKNKKVKIAVAK
ncbi:DEAD/DEAH box helicase [Chitinophagaceae bacterium LB-8]|uniref:DEAD/DEAH box helicase n=1 Tax=Paraflavisolibacter caeni TaxID=2982496 RepID=A0A9X2XPS1_9BACT|nr:DEAD/DEAH box helicase [Paraflavisolibacter caeni]MCU7552043.1 DEAD/DEAH box helicase [Paraflavisolibacter caeni]